MMRSTSGPQGERDARTLEREGELIAPLTRAYADPLALSRTRAQQASALHKQNEFLQDLVRRLQIELRLHLETCSHSMSDEEIAARNDGLPLPPWVADPEHFSPLLHCYDARIRELESIVNTAQSDLSVLQVRTKHVVSENERLLAEVKFWTEEARKRAEQDDVLSPPLLQGGALGVDLGYEAEQRIRLLTAENETLNAMHSFAQQEMARAQGDLQMIVGALHAEGLSGGVGDLRRLISQMASEKEQFARERQRMQEEIHSLKLQLASSAGGGKSHEFSSSSSSSHRQNQNQQQQNQTSSSSPPRTNNNNNQQEVINLKRSLSESQAANRSFQDHISILEQETRELRERFSDSQQLMANMRREGEDVARAMERLEKEVEGGRTREIQLHQQLKSQQSVTEAARMAVETAETREGRLREELQRCEARIKSLLTDGQKHNQETLKSMKNKLTTQTSVLKEEIARLDARCAELSEQYERAQRELRSSQTEMDKLIREGPGGQLTRLSAEIDALNHKLQEAERERDVAMQTAESLRLATRRQQALLEQEKQHETSVAASAQRQLKLSESQRQDLEDRNKELESKVAALERNVSELSHNIQITQVRYNEQSSAMQNELQGRISELEDRLMRASRKEEMAQQELEKLLEGHQEIESRWIETGKILTQQSSRTIAELREENSRLTERNEELGERLGRLLTDDAASHKANGMVTSGAVDRLRMLLDAAEKRSQSATQQVSDLLRSEVKLMDENKSLKGLIQKLTMERERWERAARDGGDSASELRMQLDKTRVVAKKLAQELATVRGDRRPGSARKRAVAGDLALSESSDYGND